MLYYNIPYHNAILYYKILYYTTLHYTTLYFTLLIGNNILYYLHPRHRVKGCGLAQRYKRACVRLPRALTPYVVHPGRRMAASSPLLPPPVREPSAARCEAGIDRGTTMLQ